MRTTLMRWREPFIKHLAKLSLHTDRFIMAKGNCSHFTHMYPELMQKTLKLKRDIDAYHTEYREWIETSGAVKNPSRFLVELFVLLVRQYQPREVVISRYKT